MTNSHKQTPPASQAGPPGNVWVAAFRRGPYLWVLLPVCIALIWGVVLPLGALVVESLVDSQARWGIAAYTEAFTQPTFWESVVNSVGISAMTVVCCALIGVPLAIFLSLFDFPGRRMLAVMANLPLVLPPLVGVLAFLFLYDETGLATRLVMKIFHLEMPPWSLRGRAAIIAVHTYSMYAYFYSFTSAALERVDFSLVEAARSLGGRPWVVWRRVVLPLLSPAFAGAALLTFMTSMASFSAPYLFGGGVRYLTIEIFNAYANRQFELAMAESVLLAAISIPMLIFLQRFEGTRRFASVSKGTVRRRPLVSRVSQVMALSLSTSVVLFLMLPPAMLILLSVVGEGSWRTTLLPTEYTLTHYHSTLTEAITYQPILNSLAMSLPAAVAAGIFGSLVAYMVVRLRFPGQRFLSGLVLVPWVLPGTVVALCVIAAYRTPHWYSAGQVLVGTFWILPFIYFLRTWPLATRAVQTNFEQFDASQEEAARTLGAGWLYAMWRVVLPQVWPGLVNGVTLAFVTLLGEFAASVLAFVFRNRPISVEIASQLRAANLGRAAVYGVVLMIMMGAALGAGEVLKQKWRPRK